MAHVGMQYGSPFRPSFTLLLHSDIGLDEIGVSPEYVFMQETGCFLTACRLAEMLNQKREWYVQMYTLEESPRYIAEMVPGHLGARKMASDPVKLWPPERGGRLELEDDPDDPDAPGDAPGGDEGDGEEGGSAGGCDDEGDGDGGGDEGDSCEDLLPDDTVAERSAEAMAAGWEDLLDELLTKMDDGPPAPADEAAAPLAAEPAPPAAGAAASSSDGLLNIYIYIRFCTRGVYGVSAGGLGRGSGGGRSC